ncbi:hypothetical protein GTQ99_17425 [Kineococcus sp. T13]|uniref:hypothetical protein n=1 Tax=Kineococcus vitellinus TaxID=2696565 RepID=UPI0014122303|nr:hypothetical protein [Kineococcus vitellinus]NAZ77190.1 hypothetical protein [Kineococcus vitellinus]
MPGVASGEPFPAPARTITLPARTVYATTTALPTEVSAGATATIYVLTRSAPESKSVFDEYIWPMVLSLAPGSLTLAAGAVVWRYKQRRPAPPAPVPGPTGPPSGGRPPDGYL